MNKLINVINTNMEQGKKTYIFRTDMEIFREDTSKADFVACLKENQISAVILKVSAAITTAIALAGILEGELNIPVILESTFHPIFLMGMKEFTQAIKDAGISAVHVTNLPMEEQGQLQVHLLDAEGPFLLKEVSPASRDRSMQIMEYARGMVLCSDQGDLSAMMELPGDPLEFYLFAISCSAPVPAILDFRDDDPEKLKAYLDSADGLVLGDFLMPVFEKKGYNKEKLDAYLKRYI